MAAQDKYDTWDKCQHEWRLKPGDWDCPPQCEQVICEKCKCPGERNTETKDVFWPAT